MKAKAIAVVGLVTIMALAAMWPVFPGVKPAQAVPDKGSDGQQVGYPPVSQEDLQCSDGILSN